MNEIYTLKQLYEKIQKRLNSVIANSDDEVDFWNQEFQEVHKR